ncbi:hypothetical protein FHP29_18580 [Nocardioides albidus]|uniref:Uncharacterized protein n=1 Tax=Nocardioides albidus TaxID=1517589 RepID=A0A5C4VJT4_9ACTN|nr:hypothetical protein [Nocardioides albidus]TNM36193.1 hypothetical protein FHP29_18580 [Nocardioides albidus]
MNDRPAAPVDEPADALADAITDTLADIVVRTHAVLEARLRSAESCRPTQDTPRAAYGATDPFLASTSRHVAAANAVLGPAARHHLEHGQQRAHELAQQSRRLEVALGELKAKLYGSTFATHRTWSSIWAELERELSAQRDLEVRLVEDLTAVTSAQERDALAERLYRCERRVPTRPHPYLPHRGVSGRLARRVALRVDRFWDTAEGRMIPEPVRPRRRRDGRITQYLLADPHLPADR